MSTENTTLKDIATVLGVSATTVHRALNGKSGISREMREQIRQTALQMGYHTNLAASALKRKTLRIGVLLPEPMMNHGFYYAALWEGIYRFMNESENLNAKLVEFPYPLLPSAHGAMLKDIYENHCSDLDGLISLGIDDNQSSFFMEKISQRTIPTVILGSDLYRSTRLCCVKSYEQVVGNLAAELITTFLPQPFQGTIILTGNPVGPSAMLDQYYNLSAFQNYMEREFPGISLRSAYCADTAQLESLLAPFLDETCSPLPFAIYASSARHTIQMCQIVNTRNLTGKIKLIGNDNFPESLPLLRNGTLTSIIDKKIPLQSYMAAKILHEYLVKGQYPEHELIQIRPEILLKSNLPEE